MATEPPRPVLKGKKALVVGVANEHSIAYGCAAAFHELGPQKIRVHPISPGPLKTRAASGLKDFDMMLSDAIQRAPVGELVDTMDAGFACAYLATPYARRITGQTIYVDGGMSIMA